MAAALARTLETRGRAVSVLRPLAPEGRVVDDVRFVHQALGGRNSELDRLKDRFLSTYFSYRLALSAVREIVPRLEAGVSVVADRYLGSHVVNQAVFGEDLQPVRGLLERLPPPDVTLFLQVPVPVALERLQPRPRRGVGDHRRFLEAADAGFQDQAILHGWVVLDGTRAPEVVAVDAADQMERALGAAEMRR